mmetsp:Transcript_22514/g.39905  ORF Transcript_22514/g.39905 Transcript_22514/m.39905 type:complete len:114 (-) Transcript_22514:404-745(-)
MCKRANVLVGEEPKSWYQIFQVPTDIPHDELFPARDLPPEPPPGGLRSFGSFASSSSRCARMHRMEQYLNVRRTNGSFFAERDFPQKSHSHRGFSLAGADAGRMYHPRALIAF